MLVEYLAFFAALGLSRTTVGQITSDTYFYGNSPGVYPSPNITGSGDWSSAYAKAKAFVAQLTLEEKSSLTYGVPANSGCAGTIPAISRLGFPGLCLSDAGNGLRATDFVNGYPSGIHVGASWNKSLAYDRGNAMAYEFRTKGVNVALGPVIGPLGRVAEGGRNWEGISNDPYLCGILGAETVEGFQDMGVITSVKHYIANEQETNRVPTTDSGGTVAAVSSNIDDKTMHEMYLWPFADAVHAGAGNIMCSYNRVNNSYACQNSKMLNGLLKTELGFQGFVVTDWGALHGGVASTLAGLEMAMANDQGFWGAPMIEAVNNGSVPEWRLDDMATRIIATWYKMGQSSGYPTPGIGMPPSYVGAHTAVNAKSPAAKSVLLEGAIEGHVLVKNVNNALPLKSPQLVFVAGYDAAGPSALGTGFWSFDHPLTWPETLTVGGGSGNNNPAYISSPLDALSQRAWEDGTTLYYDVVNDGATASIDPTTDACIVFINGYATEGWDRLALHDTFSDDLVNNVAAQCANTIVVIHSAGIYLVDAFADNPHVTAIIMAHLPGQDSGRAIVSLLYGDSNPSGKLPYTIAKSESDYGTLLAPTLPEDDYAFFPQSNFSEGLYIDYRAFDQSNISPRYEFGFGLSYTTFAYSNLRIGNVSNTDEYPTGAVLEGGKQDLWDTIVTIGVTVNNTGSVDGQEVAQLYLGIPESPARQLRGFEKVEVRTGESADVEFQVRRRDLSVWDVVAQDWKLQSGSYGVYVGASSRLLYLNGTLTI